MDFQDLSPDFQKTLTTAYHNQRRRAKHRKVEWKFCFETWIAFWMAEDRYLRRGRHKGDLVMARKGDTGSYSPENVFCATAGDNVREAEPQKRCPVMTPEGEFASLKDAARHFGVTHQTIFYRINHPTKSEWQYL